MLVPEAGYWSLPRAGVKWSQDLNIQGRVASQAAAELAAAGRHLQKLAVLRRY